MWQRLWQLLRGEGGFGRISVGAAMVIALGGGLGAYYVTQGGAPAGTANFWIDTTGGSCARQSPPAGYQNNGTECDTLDEAYHTPGTACGDLVLVKSGTYPMQTITEVAGLSGCGSNRVTFQNASGETPTIDNDADNTRRSIRLGSTFNGPSSDGPDAIAIKGFTVLGDFIVWGDVDNVLIEGNDGGALEMEVATNITIRNNDFGPCPSTVGIAGYPGRCERIKILDTAGGATNLANILFEHNTVHDFTISQAGDHSECFFTQGGGTNVVIRNNRIWNCDTYGINTGPRDGVDYVDWVIENNWFGNTCCFGGPRYDTGTPRTSAIHVNVNEDILIRYNSFAAGQTIVDENPGDPNTNVVAIGNILGNADTCIDITYDFNVFIDSTSCGPNASTASDNLYVNVSDSSSGDYHLTGAETTAADNKVTTTTGDYALTTDYDEQSRPQDGTTRDAGSDER